MTATGVPAFEFDVTETSARLGDFIERGAYAVFLVRAGTGEVAAFITLTETRSLYAGGVFGIIPEFFVRPEFRSRGLGAGLIAHARAYALGRGWQRLEVTTPPLPDFDRTLAFYQREGFSITGGRKLKSAL
jgi:GNAT superfamily N-acetyltransferase